MAADQAAVSLEASFTPEKLRDFIANGGFAPES
jgi:hypothetical protein